MRALQPERLRHGEGCHPRRYNWRELGGNWSRQAVNRSTGEEINHMTAREIAELLGASLEGDGNREISGANTLEQAKEAEAAFVEGPQARKAAASSRAGCLIVPTDMPALGGRALIRVAKPRNAFARLLQALYPSARPEPGVHAAAVVARSAVIGKGVSIGPYSVIGENVSIGPDCVIEDGVKIGDGCAIGRDCRIHARVAIYPKVSIGDRVILHSGAVIGSDGFGYAFEGGRYEKFPQIGTVEIGNDVEIGANTCVDRAALGATVIGEGSKLDNLVHIGHNCRLGRHVVIAAQTGLSGGVIVDDYVVMGGQVGIGEKAHLKERVVVGGQCGILPLKTVPAGVTVWGTPSRPHREYLEKLALLGRLPKLAAEVKDLRKRIKEIETA
jgi:UDP-3-O-[3-hydroxymyristoyl] glucosamine N-acyltransferase